MTSLDSAPSAPRTAPLIPARFFPVRCVALMPESTLKKERTKGHGMENHVPDLIRQRWSVLGVDIGNCVAGFDLRSSQDERMTEALVTEKADVLDAGLPPLGENGENYCSIMEMMPPDWEHPHHIRSEGQLHTHSISYLCLHALCSPSLMLDIFTWHAC